MASTHRYLSVAITLAFLHLVPAVGQVPYPYYAPKLTNSKDGEVHDFPLGVLSATGRLQHGATAIVVMDVGADGPGQRGGLQVGDAIVAIEGKAMPPYSSELDAGLMGPQTVLATALDEGCARSEPKLKISVMRNGQQVPLDIVLPASPRYARTFPQQCQKAAAYRRAAYQWLLDNQRSDGTWPGHIGGDSPDYQVSYVGLALLSAGDPQYLPAIEKAVRFVRSHRITGIDLNDPNAGPKNWIAAAAAIFLSEYCLATGDDSVLPDVQKCCDLLAKRVAANGRMGHHAEISYGGGGLTIVNVHAHLAWALAAKCGCRIDLTAWNRSMGEIAKAMTDNGAVGYSSAARGDNDAPARTGGMAAALVISGQHLNAANAMGRWLIVKNNRLRHAHTNCAMGLFFGTAGIKQANPRQLPQHLQNWLPYLELCRSAHGAASYFGSKRNFGGDEYLGLAPLANATIALMLASPEDKLFLFGGKTKGWLTKAPAGELVDAPAKSQPAPATARSGMAAGSQGAPSPASQDVGGQDQAAISGAGQPTARQKAPVPDGPAQQKSQDMAREVYGGRFQQAKTVADKTALAAEMIDAALNVENGSADQYALLKIARDIAAGAGDAPAALRAVEELVGRFDLPAAKLTAEALLAAGRNATTTGQHRAVGEAVLSVVDGVADGNESELALSLCELARSSAQKARQNALAKELTAKIDELKKRQSTSQEYRDAVAVLDKDPTDPTANLAAGRHLCVVKGDWARGVPMLALGSDAAWKDAAAKELRGAESAEAQAEIGDAWWDLAQSRAGSERDALLLRAGFWYRQAEPKLAGKVVGLKIKQRLEEVSKLGGQISAPSAPPPPAIAPFDEKTAKAHQTAWAKHLNVAVVQTNSINIKLALIPPGEFDIGSSDQEIAQLLLEAQQQKAPGRYAQHVRHEGPRHRVRITRPFQMGVCEVTQAHYQAIMGGNPSKFQGDPTRPAEQVTWHEAVEFCRRLSASPQEKAAGAVYRLPTEAEWEHACRAGTATRFSFGDAAQQLSAHAWWSENSRGQTAPVGRLRPNAWGLSDLHGNVWEWCADWHAGDYYTASPSDDPTGPESGVSRVLRGGAWDSAYPGHFRCAYRPYAEPDARVPNYGFRVVKTIAP